MVENIKCVIAELLEESMLDIPLDEGEDMAPLYVVTNRAKLNGAASMVFISELRDSSDVFEQDLYILPSSIHEVLVLPVQYADIKELRWMVKEVMVHCFQKKSCQIRYIGIVVKAEKLRLCEINNENFKVIFQGKTCKFIVASQEIYREMAVICCSQKILYPFMKKLQV